MTVEPQPLWVRSHDGLNLYSDVTGSGPAVVGCNGIVCSDVYWRELRMAMRSYARFVFWDYRAHGQSDVPPRMGSMTIANLVEDLIRVLDAHRLDTALLLGHSLGTQVALECYRRYPDRVAGMVLVCGSAGRPAESWTPLIRSRLALKWTVWSAHLASPVVDALKARVPNELAYDVARRIGAVHRDLASFRDMRDYFEHIRSLDSASILELLADTFEHDARDMLGDVKVPTLVVGAELDTLAPPSFARGMHADIPDSELLMLEDTTHAAPIERPTELHDAIQSFVGRRLGWSTAAKAARVRA